MNSKEENDERDFSVELKSSKNLTRLSTANEPDCGVLIEGTLGKLEQAIFQENTIFEVKVESGVFIINLRKNEISCPKAQAEEVPKEEQ